MAEPPKEACAEGELVAFVRKFKSTLSKKWSYTKAESLWSMADLACFLWALERPHEASAIACLVAREFPTPPPLKGGRFNFNIWSPVARLHGLAVRLGTDRHAIEFSRSALLSEPGFARDNPDYLGEQVTDAQRLSITQLGLEAQKWECVEISRSITCMVLFEEVANAGDPLFKPYSRDGGKLVPILLSKLSARLCDKK